MKLDTGIYDLDEVDVRLLQMLQEDAKSSLSQLGGHVNLSAPAVMERVRKLEQAGVITGYHARVNAPRVGLDIAAFIGVHLGNLKGLAEVEAWIDHVPEVLECHHVTGGPTLMLKVRARNTHALEELINRVRSLEGVENTETMVILSTHTERSALAFATSEPPASARRRPKTRRKTPKADTEERS